MKLLKDKMTTCLQQIIDIIEYAEDNDLVNTQEFLDFEDILNEYSVKY